MDRNAIHREYNAQSAVYDKAQDLDIHKQLSGYSTMTPEQRRAVSPQVSRLAVSLGVAPNVVKKYMLPPYSIFDQLDPVAYYNYRSAARVNPVAAAEHVPYHAYRPSASSIKNRLATQKHTCSFYISKLKMVEDELKQVKEENARLEKENAALIELLPGRGGSRKRTIRRKRN